MSTPMDILEKAYHLTDVEKYDEIPVARLLGRTWMENEGLRAALRQLRRAGLIEAGSSPGFLRLG